MDNSANFAALKDATLGAQAIQAPASSLGASSAPQLAQLYQSTFQLPQSQGATAAHAQLASQAVAEQKAAAAAAKAAAASQSDPSKYKVIAKDDGGYAFFDPTGKEISANDYARVTGKDPASILKDSQNPIDQAFVNDYNNLQQYFQDKANSKFDQTAADNASTLEAQVKKAYGIDLAKQNPKQVIETFKNAYPTVFGRTTTGPQGINTFLPNVSAPNFVPVGGGGNTIGG